MKADLAQLAQNGSHWRVLVDTEVYLHSFLYYELSGASISFTIRCPSNRKMDGLGADLDPVQKICLALVDSHTTIPRVSSLVSTPTKLLNISNIEQLFKN